MYRFELFLLQFKRNVSLKVISNISFNILFN